MKAANETAILPVRSERDTAGLPKKGVYIIKIPANTNVNRFSTVYSVWCSGDWMKDTRGYRRAWSTDGTAREVVASYLRQNPEEAVRPEATPATIRAWIASSGKGSTIGEGANHFGITALEFIRIRDLAR